MKNIYLLPTDKPSKLVIIYGTLRLNNVSLTKNLPYFKPHHIYITSDEIGKHGEYVYWGKDTERPIKFQRGEYLGAKKIILTTDPQLIAYGVQAIDDEFLEWFVKNPSCEFVKIGLKGNIIEGYHTVPSGQISSIYLKHEIFIPKQEQFIEFTNTNDCTSMIYNSEDEPKQESDDSYIKDQKERRRKLLNLIDKLELEQEKLQLSSKQETLEIKDGNQLAHQFEEWNTLFELQAQCKNLGFSELQIHSVLSNKFQLKNRDKVEKETLEKAAQIKYGKNPYDHSEKNGFIKGAEWMQERIYNEEEVLNILKKSHEDRWKKHSNTFLTKSKKFNLNNWIRENLSKQPQNNKMYNDFKSLWDFVLDRCVNHLDDELPQLGTFDEWFEQYKKK